MCLRARVIPVYRNHPANVLSACEAVGSGKEEINKWPPLPLLSCES